jgi:hypothetical protein
MRALFFAVALLVLIQFVASAQFIVYFDNGCSSPIESLSSKTGVIPAPGKCINGDNNNSTFALCYVDKTNTQTVQFKTWKSAPNCPSTTPDSYASSTGPAGGCNAVTIVSGGSTYNFYLQGSCSQSGFHKLETVENQWSNVVQSAAEEKRKYVIRPQ